MLPPDSSIWGCVPGRELPSSNSLDGVGQAEVMPNAKRRYQEVANVLARRWANVPIVKFAPPPFPDTDPAKQPSVTGIPPADVDRGPCFRIEQIGAPVVRETLLSNAVNPCTGKEFVLQWSGPGVKESTYQELGELQKVNHFPGSTELTRKDRLWSHFDRLAKTYGEEDFDFVPQTFVLPEQFEEFLHAYESDPDKVWIVKPNASSQGRGIFLLEKLSDLPVDKSTVVSRYIDNPLLIQGLKFDLRVYVLVTGYDPLRLYVYREGLVRFASKRYSMEKKHRKDEYRHLTNYSINRFAPNFVENSNVIADNIGHKWSFSALNKHLGCTGVDVDLMWSRVMDLIVKTLVGVAPTIAEKTKTTANFRCNCFELYGFDVMVDSDLKPWLLEANLSPSMSAESPLDWHIKSHLLSDAFNIVGISRVDQRTVAASRCRARERLCLRSGALAEPTNPKCALKHLDGDELRTLARAFLEINRCQNFIRLYPTAASVERYARLTDSPHLSSSRRFAYLLLNNCEVKTRPFSASFRRQRRPSTPHELSRHPSQNAETEPDEHAEAAEPLKNDDFSCENEPPATSSTAPVVPSRRGRPASSGAGRRVGNTLEDHMAPAIRATPMSSSLRRAWERIKAVGHKHGSRLVVMEYLCRVRNACLTVIRRCQSQQFTPQATNVLLHLSERLSVHCQDEETEASSDKPSILERLAASCKSGATSLAREVADQCAEDKEDGSESACGEDQPAADEDPSAEDKLALAELLPPEFKRNATCRKALATLSVMGALDLEAILFGSFGNAVFNSLVRPANASTGTSSPRRGSLRARRPLSAMPRHQSHAGNTKGALCELLTMAALADPEPLTRPVTVSRASAPATAVKRHRSVPCLRPNCASLKMAQMMSALASVEARQLANKVTKAGPRDTLVPPFMGIPDRRSAERSCSESRVGVCADRVQIVEERFIPYAEERARHPRYSTPKVKRRSELCSDLAKPSRHSVLWPPLNYLNIDIEL